MATEGTTSEDPLHNHKFRLSMTGFILTPSFLRLKWLTGYCMCQLDQSITNLGIPVIPPSKVFLPQYNIKDGLPQRPTKVFTNDGMTCFFKPTHVPESAIREISTLLRLQGLGLSENVRAPRLYGLVQYQDSSKITGMLLEYIEHEDDLGHIDVQATALAVREKWIDQIKYIIKSLHPAGIVRGDAKPENLLVDTDENLWIIDFGGGYTQDWVDEGNEGTIEGDNQALSRIVDFLTGEAEKDVT
ncbi:hypothetical protein MW887_004280 [Aspergillus wentii]|nr:hypothetical protein MW887_004280 [Aspergillus wentii]